MIPTHCGRCGGLDGWDTAISWSNGLLADFDYVGGGGRGGFGLQHQPFGDVVEGCGLRAFGSGERDGQAAVAALPDGRDEFDGAKEGKVVLLRGVLGAAAGEDVDLLCAVGAGASGDAPRRGSRRLRYGRGGACGRD